MFTADSVAALGGPDWLRRRRSEAFDEFVTTPLPSEKEEVWRYTPIDQLDLDSYQPANTGTTEGSGDEGAVRAYVERLRAELPARAALLVVHGGQVVTVEDAGLPDGFSVGGLARVDETTDAHRGPGLLGRSGDALVRLNDAFHPDVVVVDVPPGSHLDGPIVIAHWCGTAAAGSLLAPASFPRTVVRVGRGSSASVVEVLAGPTQPAQGLAAGLAEGLADKPEEERGPRALVVPVVELSVEDGSQLAYVSLQILGPAAWSIGRLVGDAVRDATLRVFTVGLGGSYARMRTDTATTGPGATTALYAAYLGVGSQVHDIRTMQDHRAPRTTSDLLCKGAVTGTSHSVYSGLIRVRHGAVRTEAMQTNHNLVLDERAHADSVPNLDIEENDVRCSHASTVGPVDEDQLYYLESRGISPERAKRLIVLGFFDDIVSRAPEPAMRPCLQGEIGSRLVGALGTVEPELPEGTSLAPERTAEASAGNG